jgi:Sulfatase
LFGLIANGFSQIFFNLVLSNKESFVLDPTFTIWVMLWCLVVPFLILWGMDWFLAKRGFHHPIFRVWRATLYALLFLSMLRQGQIIYSEKYQLLFGSFPFLIPYAVLGIGVFLISLYSSRNMHFYISVFGITGLILTVQFLYGALKARPEAVSENGTRNVTETMPVILILFDELSAKELSNGTKPDPALYPNFNKLSGESLWFRNATANYWTTNESLQSLFTGSFQIQNQGQTLFDYLPARDTTLITSEMWVENWFRSRVQEKINRYRGKAYFLKQDPILTARYLFSTVLDYDFFSTKPEIIPLFNTRSFHFTYPREFELFKNLLKDKNSWDFLIWHLSVPHSPFVFDQKGEWRDSEQYSYFSLTELYNRQEMRLIRQNYREQIGFADTILGKVIEILKAENLYDRSVLIVTSDHGLRVWGDLYSDIDLGARIPFCIRAPGLKAGLSDDDFQLIDFAPTLLDLLKIPYDEAAFEGVSPFVGRGGDRLKLFHYNFQTLALDTDGSWRPAETKNRQASSLADAFSDTHRWGRKHFSAMQVLDDLRTSQDRKIDFLALYLDRHFPFDATEADVVLLYKNRDTLRMKPPSVAINFQRGMNCFFVALWETHLLSKGDPEADPAKVREHWNESVRWLRQTGHLENSLPNEIEKLLQASDQDQNGQLTAQELSSIVSTRT